MTKDVRNGEQKMDRETRAVKEEEGKKGEREKEKVDRRRKRGGEGSHLPANGPNRQQQKTRKVGQHFDRQEKKGGVGNKRVQEGEWRNEKRPVRSKRGEHRSSKKKERKRTKSFRV